MYIDKEYFLLRINAAELDKLIDTANTEDEGVANLEGAINSASGLVDTYLRNVVTVPLTSVPDIVKQLTYDVAVFYLHDRIQYAEVPERVRDKYDAAISLLKDIAKGQASLNLPSGSTDTPETNIQSGGNELLMNRTIF